MKAYRDGFAATSKPQGGFQPGAHDENYWRRMAPDEMSFVGAHLTG